MFVQIFCESYVDLYSRKRKNLQVNEEDSQKNHPLRFIIYYLNRCFSYPVYFSLTTSAFLYNVRDVNISAAELLHNGFFPKKKGKFPGSLNPIKNNIANSKSLNQLLTMAKNNFFFYVKDVLKLIEEAKNAGGEDLGVIISANDGDKGKPKLKVGYFKKAAENTRVMKEEDYTGSIDGCPYPPRCQ